MNNFNDNSIDGADTYTDLTHVTTDGVAGASMTIQTVIDKDELKCMLKEVLQDVTRKVRLGWCTRH